MSKIAKNISVLRGIKKMSQEELANHLDVPRSRIGSYEESRAEPSYDLLIKIADYFHVSIDALLRVDFSKTPPNSLLKIDKNRLLLPILVDKENNDLVEVVSLKASAGYLNGYADPEFIEDLPVMNLPFKIIGKHRAFYIKGDSMPPLKDGSVVVGRYVENLKEIKDGQTYIIISKTEGIVYKRIYRINKQNAEFSLQSDNPYYEPYNMKAENILEIWSFVCSLNIGEFRAQDMNIENVIRFLQSLRVEMGKS